MTRVLVTGAGGFIGANVLFELKQRQNLPPLGWSRPGGNTARLKHLAGIDITPVDITQPKEVARAIDAARPNVVINAAAYGVDPKQSDTARTRDINVRGTEILLAAARTAGVRRFLHLGTYFEYGDQPGTLKEGSLLLANSPYASTKAVASRLATSGDFGSMEVAVLRLFNIWGRWERADRLVPQIIDACHTKMPMALTAGTQRKDFVYAGDAAAWICDLALQPSPLLHRAINLASGEMVSVKDFATAIAQELGQPDVLQFGAKPMPAGEPQSGPADTTRIDALLPNRRRTPLKAALAEMMGSS